MTITQALKLAIDRLGKAKIPFPHLEAEVLLSSILKKTREFILTHPEKNLTLQDEKKFQTFIRRRLKGVPVAYLTGHKEFFGLNFSVNRNVLIPRPETELLVAETLKLLGHRSAASIFDIGTGSGCVIIALAEQIKNYELKITNYKLIGTDISKNALTIARQNAKRHHLDKKIKFIEGDLLNPIINNSKFLIKNSDLIIVANLPYGWAEWKNNSSLDSRGLKFEPPLALYAGQKGLKLYDKFFQQIKKFRRPGSRRGNLTVLCEIDPRQKNLMKKLIKKYFPKIRSQIKKDLAGLDRLIIFTLS